MLKRCVTFQNLLCNARYLYRESCSEMFTSYTTTPGPDSTQNHPLSYRSPESYSAAQLGRFPPVPSRKEATHVLGEREQGNSLNVSNI